MVGTLLVGLKRRDVGRATCRAEDLGSPLPARRGDLDNSYPRQLVTGQLVRKTTRTRDNSYPGQLIPRITRTLDSSYPILLVSRTTHDQDDSYPRQLIPNATRTQDNS